MQFYHLNRGSDAEVQRLDTTLKVVILFNCFLLTNFLKFEFYNHV